MKKHIIAVAVAVIVAVGTWLLIDSLSATNEEKVQDYLNDDKAQLERVAESMLDSPYTGICLVDDSGYDYETNIKVVQNSADLTAVKYLLDEHGYQEIRRTGNTVRFVKWTRMADFESGICYVHDGTPNIEFLTAAKPLSVNGWYYYEADYNEWRTDN